MMTAMGRVRRIIEKDGDTLVSFDAHSAYFHAGADIVEALRQAETHGLLVHFTYDDALRIVGVVAHNG